MLEIEVISIQAEAAPEISIEKRLSTGGSEEKSAKMICNYRNIVNFHFYENAGDLH
jgi:hypothetical protein